MHRRKVVPDHNVPQAPLVRINELGLCCKGHQVCEQRLRLVWRPADNSVGMGSKVEGAVPGWCVTGGSATLCSKAGYRICRACTVASWLPIVGPKYLFALRIVFALSTLAYRVPALKM